MNDKILVITGMHRSGTSLLTQWLYKCGLHVGADFMGADIGNSDGHYEDLDFYKIHRNILNDMALPDDGMVYEGINNISDGQRHELRSLVKGKCATQAQWGWKDPRTCLFLGTYREILPEARYIVILRDYRSVVSSLISRLFKRTAHKYALKGGISLFVWKHFKRERRKRKLLKKFSEHYLKVWINYNHEILQHLSLLPWGSYLVVDHTKLPATNEQVFQHLTQAWDFGLTYFNFTQIYKNQLISDVWNIEAYIKDKKLIEKAKTLQERLLRYAM